MIKKYKNTKTSRLVNGKMEEFDSLKEAKRYDQLYLMLRSNTIQTLSTQPKFTLQEAFIHKGIKHRAITYSADFRYTKDGVEYIEDVKGFKTEVYKIKKKLLLFKHPEINFVES
jgi:hypothetical protein